MPFGQRNQSTLVSQYWQPRRAARSREQRIQRNASQQIKVLVYPLQRLYSLLSSSTTISSSSSVTSSAVSAPVPPSIPAVHHRAQHHSCGPHQLSLLLRTKQGKLTSHHTAHQRHPHPSTVPSPAAVHPAPVAVPRRVRGSTVHSHRGSVLVRVLALLLEKQLASLKVDAVLFGFLTSAARGELVTSAKRGAECGGRWGRTT